MELVDTVKYFAKFPLRSGVLKCFADDNSTVPGYSDLKNYITALPQNGLFPDIKNFIISIDEKKISDQIKSMDGFFMYLEYAGIIGTALDNLRNRDVDFKWAIIIGYNWNGRSNDSMAEILIMDRIIEIINQIAIIIKQDDAQTCANKRLLDSAFNLTPIPPYLLYQNHGWELSFSKRTKIMQ